MEIPTQLIDWVKSLKIFKRNKKPIELKVKAFLLWLIMSSCRKTAKMLEILNEQASKSSINEWCLKIRTLLESKEWHEIKKRSKIAIDETCIKLNGKKFYVFAAIDVETKELIEIRAYTSRSALTTRIFLKSVLCKCLNKPKIIRDKAPWLEEGAKELNLEQEHKTRGERNFVERVFSYLKHRTRIFFNNINVKFKKVLRKLRESEEGVALKHLNSFLRAFKYYYDFLR